MRFPLRLIGVVLFFLAPPHAWAGASGYGKDDARSLSRSLEGAEQRRGTAHPDLLAILGPFARLRFLDADLAEAMALRRRSLKIVIGAFASDSVPSAEATEIDQNQLGAAHPLIADDLYDLGMVYLETRRAADAQNAFQAAINLLDRGAGRDAPRSAYIKLALARAVHEQGRE